MTTAVMRMLRGLDALGTATASELGEHMWGSGSLRPQAYARPAGALLRRAERAGLVQQIWQVGRDRERWTLARDGRVAVREVRR